MEIEAKNFGLTKKEFNHLLHTLSLGSNELFKKIFLAQSESCIKHLQIKYNANYDLAYDTMIDTMIDFRRRMIDKKVEYGNLRYLFLQMASQDYLRAIKKEKKYTTLEAKVSDYDEIERTKYGEDQISILSKAWQKLSTECQELLRLNYYGALKLKEIAEMNNDRYDTLRKKKQRCKQALINFFNAESNE